MTLRFLALAAALAAAPTTMLAASLVKVGEAGIASVYVDKDSMRRNGSQVRAALEWRWTKGIELPDNPARTYRMERQLQISNCDNKSYAVAEGTQYADERGTDPVRSYKNDESSLPYSVAPARTIRDVVVTYVCTAAPAAKKP